MKKIAFSIAFGLVYGLGYYPNPVLALEHIPSTSGVSGFISLGGAYLDVESNMISGNDFGDIGNNRISSLTDSPDSNSTGNPIVNFELRYTFANARTQLFIGNELESFLRYDLTTQAGVRYELGDLSTVSASFVFNSVPTEVWADPYVVNVDRSKTDRDSRGIRLTWDEILGSNFQTKYTFRDIDLDNERSGSFLGLPGNEANLLRRTGNSHEVEVLYRYEFSDKHRFTPAIIYTKFDLDGDAMNNDEFLFQLTYGYQGEKVRLVANGVIGFADYDEQNPIYRQKQDNDIYGVSLTGFYARPFGWDLALGIRRWSFFATAGYFKSDANINFYDTQVITAGGGIFVKF